MTSADPSNLASNGDDVCASIEPDGTTYRYIFDHGYGDCPAGWTEHDYWGFTVDSSGAITALGKATAQDPKPAWLTADCVKWL